MADFAFHGVWGVNSTPSIINHRCPKLGNELMELAKGLAPIIASARTANTLTFGHAARSRRRFMTRHATHSMGLGTAKPRWLQYRSSETGNPLPKRSFSHRRVLPCADPANPTASRTVDRVRGHFTLVPLGALGAMLVHGAKPLIFQKLSTDPLQEVTKPLFCLIGASAAPTS